MESKAWNKEHHRHSGYSLISRQTLSVRWENGKVLTKLYDKRKVFFLSTLLSSIATSHQHLRIEFLWYNSYGMPELDVLKQSYIAKSLKSFLQKFKGRHHQLIDCGRSIKLHNGNRFVHHVLIIHYSFVYSGFDILWATCRVIQKNERTLTL